MKELFFYILGSFSGIFLMCCLEIAKRDTGKIDDSKQNKK